jgi:ribosomal protein S18 acetylase RimI-like enzyme
MAAMVNLANGVRVEFANVTAETWPTFQNEILLLERCSFPPSIRDSEESLRELAHSKTGVFIAGYSQEQAQVVGYCCGDRLNKFDDIPGVSTDLHRHATTSFYMSSVAVHPSWRKLGIGLALERECIARARQHHYTRITAHVRHGFATKISRHASILSSYDNWYDTGEKYDYVLLWQTAKGDIDAAT